MFTNKVAIFQAKAADTPDKSVSHLDNPSVEDENVKDHENLDDPEPLNDVTSDLNDLVNDQNLDSIRTERCEDGRTDAMKDNIDTIEDNTDAIEDAAQPDYDESEELSLM